ncbi:hypothetical protein WA158_006778 [Blastocystis sp. Blastoise]
MSLIETIKVDTENVNPDLSTTKLSSEDQDIVKELPIKDKKPIVLENITNVKKAIPISKKVDAVAPKKFGLVKQNTLHKVSPSPDKKSALPPIEKGLVYDEPDIIGDIDIDDILFPKSVFSSLADDILLNTLDPLIPMELKPVDTVELDSILEELDNEDEN